MNVATLAVLVSLQFPTADTPLYSALVREGYTVESGPSHSLILSKGAFVGNLRVYRSSQEGKTRLNLTLRYHGPEYLLPERLAPWSGKTEYRKDWNRAETFFDGQVEFEAQRFVSTGDDSELAAFKDMLREASLVEKVLPTNWRQIKPRNMRLQPVVAEDMVLKDLQDKNLNILTDSWGFKFTGGGFGFSGPPSWIFPLSSNGLHYFARQRFENSLPLKGFVITHEFHAPVESGFEKWCEEQGARLKLAKLRSSGPVIYASLEVPFDQPRTIKSVKEEVTSFVEEVNALMDTLPDRGERPPQKKPQD